MKKDRQSIIIYGLLAILVIYFVTGFFYRKVTENRLPRHYAIAYVYDFVAMQGPSTPGKYSFNLNNSIYYGTTNASGSQFLSKYFIIEFNVGKPKFNTLEIEIPIDPQKLKPQPPEGWDECPINEDGSIKEEYRR